MIIQFVMEWFGLMIRRRGWDEMGRLKMHAGMAVFCVV
jgi:hypothetical protein